MFAAILLAGYQTGSPFTQDCTTHHILYRTYIFQLDGLGQPPLKSPSYGLQRTHARTKDCGQEVQLLYLFQELCPGGVNSKQLVYE